MKNIILCQSCGMPLDKEDIKGTEKNGLKSNEYCKYCYENGVFKHPKMSLDEMKNNVENTMKKLEIHHYEIQKAVNILPALKRWKT
jgi:hypothetical protein